MAQHPPLNYENSLSLTTNHHTSTTLPPEVVQCLRNARYLHLATIARPISASDPPSPHVSLMNYTFLSNYNNEGPVILMTTNAQSLKTQNLRHNPRVSILVHEWSSHRPPTASMPDPSASARSGSPPAVPTRSSLASLLLNLNTSALSSISTTISGEARFLEAGSEEEKWCKEAHLQNNTFEGQLSTEAVFFASGGYSGAVQQPSESASGYIEGNDVRVVLVPIKTGRISDFKGGVRDWKLVSEQDERTGISGASLTSGHNDEARGRTEGLMNGIVDQDEHI
ncbi:hypothetical protein H2198_003879 [Neophaeococcomyces mojaviensis]|uniref:Uncharacterized protein n=1 Tax=Neophaeococcomyces mojaviensis TaxID=3383035 RepID=A0ACC3AAH7_9EURO|nr:hypothetical protein H2198_003879 [Knufia sp. JES_112]